MNTQNQNEQSLSRRALLTGFAVTGASALLLPRVSGIALAAEPTLEETLKWLKTKLAKEVKHTGSEGGYGQAEGSDGTFTWQPDLDAVQLTVTQYRDKEHRDKMFTYVYDFKLSELDSKCYIHRNWVLLKPVVFINRRPSGEELEVKGERSNIADLYFYSDTMAERVGDAFVYGHKLAKAQQEGRDGKKADEPF